MNSHVIGIAGDGGADADTGRTDLRIGVVMMMMMITLRSADLKLRSRSRGILRQSIFSTQLKANQTAANYPCEGLNRCAKEPISL
ncbi:hypothetical protein F2Q68_00018749 [Brassica cretica]|uniref:Uncharacterized protein n=1 Tax=Brassica cretica TaxID=69181 RepID=A0A8S9FUU0_BRACR|nr:hypothetical protein F2Q68_00018749 [Brassica cretica]